MPCTPSDPVPGLTAAEERRFREAHESADRLDGSRPTRATGPAATGGPVGPGAQAAFWCGTPFSSSRLSSSPDWNISVMMSQPPTNSPFT